MLRRVRHRFDSSGQLSIRVAIKDWVAVEVFLLNFAHNRSMRKDIHEQHGQNCVATFVLGQGSGVTLKPWCSMLPFRGQAEMIAVRHLHFRETVFVHDLVLFDNAILVEDKGGQSVDLIGF